MGDVLYPQSEGLRPERLGAMIRPTASGRTAPIPPIVPIRSDLLRYL